MRYILAAALAAIFSGSLATAAPPADAAAKVDAATRVVETPDTSVAVTPGGAPAGGDAWRFKQHRGFWWYWLPSEKWVIWSGGKWVPYDPASFAQLEAARAPRATYYRGGGSGSRSGAPGYPELGQWGRVRYNSYGQREYPYSRRTSGIRQLGPVPAMGGVRSLPGWGGER
jgi:hypothetical protein